MKDDHLAKMVAGKGFCLPLVLLGSIWDDIDIIRFSYVFRKKGKEKSFYGSRHIDGKNTMPSSSFGFSMVTGEKLL